MNRPKWIIPKIHNLPLCIYICWWNKEILIDKRNLNVWIK